MKGSLEQQIDTLTFPVPELALVRYSYVMLAVVSLFSCLSKYIVVCSRMQSHVFSCSLMQFFVNREQTLQMAARIEESAASVCFRRILCINRSICDVLTFILKKDCWFRIP